MTPYPVSNKRKATELCLGFVEGAGAAGRDTDAAVFYGVDDSNQAAWRECLATGRDWYYIDNSYFDASRGTHFRITRNRLQHSGRGSTNGRRLAALGIEIKPWQTEGQHIVICPQSEDFMHRIAGYKGNWLGDTLDAIRAAELDRPVVCRPWSSAKMALSKTLCEDLRNAWALVTHSSAAAVTAVLEGIPVFSSAPWAASRDMSGADFNRVFPMTEERQRWAGVLADNQWTLEEIRNGAAWAALT
jgi:hypothetical protein